MMSLLLFTVYGAEMFGPTADLIPRGLNSVEKVEKIKEQAKEAKRQVSEAKVQLEKVKEQVKEEKKTSCCSCSK
jgi:microcompartment protein CcmL/EutN